MKTKMPVLLFLMLVSLTASYAQIKSGDNVVIDERINGDAYVAGGTVTINAPVDGDLIAAGGTITVNDSVTQDALLAGGNVFINSVVLDDIRCAGGAVHLSGDVHGDLVVTGGTITIDKKVVISGDLLVSGGEITLNGSVNGEIKSASGSLVFNGVAGNSVDCRGGKIVMNGKVSGDAVLAANVIEVGNNALFAKSVKYWNEAGNLDFKDSEKAQSATYDPSLEIESGQWHYLGFASFIMVIWYLGTALVFIFLIHYLFGNIFKNAANTIRNSSLKSLGVGFLFIVGVPIAIVIAAITVIGLPISVLVLIAYITVILLGTVIVSLLIANWINNNYTKGWPSTTLVFAAFGIFIFLKLASLTPVIGPLIMLLLACMGFGGIVQNIKWKRNSELALT